MKQIYVFFINIIFFSLIFGCSTQQNESTKLIEIYNKKKTDLELEKINGEVKVIVETGIEINNIQDLPKLYGLLQINHKNLKEMPFPYRSVSKFNRFGNLTNKVFFDPSEEELAKKHYNYIGNDSMTIVSYFFSGKLQRTDSVIYSGHYSMEAISTYDSLGEFKELQLNGYNENGDVSFNTVYNEKSKLLAFETMFRSRKSNKIDILKSFSLSMKPDYFSQFTYDTLGRVINKSSNIMRSNFYGLSVGEKINYDDAKNTKTITPLDFSGNSSQTFVFKLDDNGKITEGYIKDEQMNNPENVFEFSYTYDSFDNWTKVKRKNNALEKESTGERIITYYED